MSKVLLFLRFVIIGTWTDMYGWAATMISLLLAYFSRHSLPFIFALFDKATIFESILITLVLALMLALVFNIIFIAPYKVWRELNPLKISPTKISQYLTEAGKTHSVCLDIENRSYLRSQFVRIEVIKIIGDKNRTLPFLIKSLNVPAKGRSIANLASCIWGGTSSYIQILPEKDSIFTKSPLLFRHGVIDLCIKVSTDRESKQLWCRVWSDTVNKTLQIKAIEPPNQDAISAASAG